MAPRQVKIIEEMIPVTIEQKQCLLYYLGYYNGKIDGSWGELSRSATSRFQETHGLQADGVFGAATEKEILAAIARGETGPVSGKVESSNGAADWWGEIKYFSRAEFACRCGKCGGYPAEPQKKLLVAADRVREKLGAPATVSSGVRCSRHNSAVGGVSNSRHLTGKAMDFSVKGKTATQILAVVQEQPEIRYAYAIDGSWVHMDIE